MLRRGSTKSTVASKVCASERPCATRVSPDVRAPAERRPSATPLPSVVNSRRAWRPDFLGSPG